MIIYINLCVSLFYPLGGDSEAMKNKRRSLIVNAVLFFSASAISFFSFILYGSLLSLLASVLFLANGILSLKKLGDLDEGPYDDDDGRTIADMSGVERQAMFLPRVPRRDLLRPPQQERPAEEERPWEETGLSREERRWYILGAMKAAMLIALVFIVGLGLVVALFCFLG